MTEEESCNPVTIRRPSLIQRSFSYIGVSIQKFSCGHPNLSVDIDEFTNKVRDLITIEFNTHPDKYDANDINLVLECHEYRYLERFLEKQRYSIDDTVKMITNTLKWRKEEGLSSLTDQSFPSICYKCGFQYIYGEDIDGNIVLHIRLKMYHKYHPSCVKMMENFFVHLAFKADQMGAKKNTGWILCSDFSSVSLRQWDLPHFLWLLRIFQNHCPAGIRKIIVYNLAWFLRPVLKTVLPVVPQNISSLMAIANGDELFEHIDRSNLPKYLGGTNELDHRREPFDNLPCLFTFMKEKYGLQYKEVKRLLEKYEKVLYD